MIKYISEPDKERPDILWEVFGDELTEEIVVVATFDEQCFEKRTRSPISHPPMCDRIFGIDMWDDQLAKDMSNEIYDEFFR